MAKSSMRRGGSLDPPSIEEKRTMTITRFDPFRLLTDVYLRDEDLTARGGWLPPVDIFETAGRDLVIKVELPDVNREDVEVTVEHNTLTLRGEKKLPADVQEDQFRRVERRYGTFTRSFTLPNKEIGRAHV